MDSLPLRRNVCAWNNKSDKWAELPVWTIAFGSGAIRLPPNHGLLHLNMKNLLSMLAMGLLLTGCARQSKESASEKGQEVIEPAGATTDSAPAARSGSPMTKSEATFI